MLVLGIKYDDTGYRYVYINRVREGVSTEVARVEFGDPVLDWRLIRLIVSALKRDGQEVHRGLSCDRFLVDVPGYHYVDGRLRREGDDVEVVVDETPDSGDRLEDGGDPLAVLRPRAHTRH